MRQTRLVKVIQVRAAALRLARCAASGVMFGGADGRRRDLAVGEQFACDLAALPASGTIVAHDLLTRDPFATQKRARMFVPVVVVVRDHVEDLVGGGARPEMLVDVAPQHLSPPGRHVGHVIDRLSGDVGVGEEAAEADQKRTGGKRRA